MSEAVGMHDRREDPRTEVEVEVDYRTAQEFLSAYARNISGGGIFIRTQRPLSLNENVRVRFTLPGIAQRFESSGIVVWSNPVSRQSFLPSGMGIKLVDLDPDSRRLIAEYVKVHTPPSTLDREL